MHTIVVANKEHTPQIRDLFYEYLDWINTKLMETYGMGMGDVSSYVDLDIQHIDKFMPPKGRLLLCYLDQTLAGMGALKELGPGMGEIKRMYVGPAYRRRGLGRALMQRLMEEAREIGYQRLRLDSAPFLPESHQLYRSTGFQSIDPYDGTEVPPEFHQNWIFMEFEFPGGRV